MTTITRTKAAHLTYLNVGREVYVIGTTPGRLSDYKRGPFRTTLYIGGRVLKVRNSATVIV